jgi:hypothetical protein
MQLKPGRKTKPAHARRAHTLYARFRAEDRAGMARAAQRKGVTITAWLRETLLAQASADASDAMRSNRKPGRASRGYSAPGPEPANRKTLAVAIRFTPAEMADITRAIAWSGLWRSEWFRKAVSGAWRETSVCFGPIVI